MHHLGTPKRSHTRYIAVRSTPLPAGPHACLLVMDLIIRDAEVAGHRPARGMMVHGGVQFP
jgi:hypothetical protein